MKEHYRDPENDGTYINKLYVDEFNNVWAIVMAWWDYDGNGQSLVNENDVIKRNNAVNNASSKSGCLGIVIIGIVLTSLIAFS